MKIRAGLGDGSPAKKEVAGNSLSLCISRDNAFVVIEYKQNEDG